MYINKLQSLGKCFRVMSETALIVQPGEETGQQNRSNFMFWSHIPFAHIPMPTAPQKVI